MAPRKIINPLTGKKINATGALAKKLKAEGLLKSGGVAKARVAKKTKKATVKASSAPKGAIVIETQAGPKGRLAEIQAVMKKLRHVSAIRGARSVRRPGAIPVDANGIPVAPVFKMKK